MTRFGWFGMCWMMLCLGDVHASGRLQAALISSADKAMAPRIVPVLHGREYLVQEDVLHVPDALPLGSQWGIYRPGRSFPLTEHDHVEGEPADGPFWGMLPVARATVIGHATLGSQLSIEDGIQEVRAGDYLLARTETPSSFSEMKKTAAEPPVSTARVVGGLYKQHYLAPQDWLVLDRGTRDGLAAGQRWRIDRNVLGQPAVAEIEVHQAAMHLSLARVLSGEGPIQTGDVAQWIPSHEK